MNISLDGMPAGVSIRQSRKQGSRVSPQRAEDQAGADHDEKLERRKREWSVVADAQIEEDHTRVTMEHAAYWNVLSMMLC